MRLPLFDIIDATIDRLNADRALYDEVANQLRIYFSNALCEHKECLLNASTRVKSPDSLREKMLRKNLYKLSADPQVILNHLSDIVGIRLQCRFMAEEQRVYRAVCELSLIHIYAPAVTQSYDLNASFFSLKSRSCSSL